jgi:hypothetical protein
MRREGNQGAVRGGTDRDLCGVQGAEALADQQPRQIRRVTSHDRSQRGPVGVQVGQHLDAPAGDGPHWGTWPNQVDPGWRIRRAKYEDRFDDIKARNHLDDVLGHRSPQVLAVLAVFAVLAVLAVHAVTPGGGGHHGDHAAPRRCHRAVGVIGPSAGA